MKWLIKEYRQAQHSVGEDLLSNLAKVQLAQRDTLSSQKKFRIHCYLTKICESELPSTNKSNLYFVKMFRVISSFSGTCTVFLNTLFSVLCTQDISHINVFTFPLETSYLLLSKTFWMFYFVFSLWSEVTGMPLLVILDDPSEQKRHQHQLLHVVLWARRTTGLSEHSTSKSALTKCKSHLLISVMWEFLSIHLSELQTLWLTILQFHE